MRYINFRGISPTKLEFYFYFCSKNWDGDPNTWSIWC